MLIGIRTCSSCGAEKRKATGINETRKWYCPKASCKVGMSDLDKEFMKKYVEDSTEEEED